MQSLAALPLPPGRCWEDYSFLLLPGLLTKWYPQYMSQLTADMRRLGLEVAFSRIDTDQASIARVRARATVRVRFGVSVRVCVS